LEGKRLVGNSPDAATQDLSVWERVEAMVQEFVSILAVVAVQSTVLQGLLA
jgi:hypothetical protein